MYMRYGRSTLRVKTEQNHSLVYGSVAPNLVLKISSAGTDMTSAGRLLQRRMLYISKTSRGLAKQRKKRSFRERKFCLRKEGFDIHLIVNISSNS